MRGILITSRHQTVQLPELLSWALCYTGGVPCDSYSVTFPYTAEWAETLRTAAGFAAWDGNSLMLRGTVDEYAVELSAQGLTATVCGRGYAARLLDNESRPMTYQAATLSEILRNHVTPYGISCGEVAEVRADSPYTVAAGSSQWRALSDFCRTYGGFVPRFRRDGVLLAVPEKQTGADVIFISEESPILRCSLREDHYGVLTDVLVIDKTRRTEYNVRNADGSRWGGQCRRVLYTPGQSTWAAMRYTGDYQIARSKEEENTLTICLAGQFLAFPGEWVQVKLPRMGISGRFRVAAADNRCTASNGSTCTLTVRKEK